MNFQYLYDTKYLYTPGNRFNIKFSKPLNKLEILDTVSFPGVEEWDSFGVEHIIHVTPTYYIILCNGINIRLESDIDKVYVLIQNMEETKELIKLVMYKDEPTISFDDRYETGIKHMF